MSIVEAKVLSAQHAERMKVNRRRLFAIAWGLHRKGQLAATKEERAEQFAWIIATEDADAFEACRVEDGRDWEAFFAALVAFIEKIMPLILMFF